MARSGVIPALVALAQSRDKERETHAIACMANLAEMVEGRTQKRMLDDGCLRPLLSLANAQVLLHDNCSFFTFLVVYNSRPFFSKGELCVCVC